MTDCVYQGDPTADGKHLCLLFKECQPTGESSQVPVCDKCKKRLKLDDRKFATKWQDPLVVLDRRKEETTALRDMLAGRSAFLVCGGPSTKDQPTDELTRRGVWSLGVNNAAGHLRTNAMVCSDPPSKFSHSIWLDPSVMKFMPTPKMRGSRSKLRKKVDGAFSDLDRRTFQCPNIWGFKRWSWMTPDDKFFLTDGACWGNHQVGADSTGQPKVVCTMLLGLRILFHLGARTIYLAGCDFHMRPDYGYSFSQARDDGASHSNNEHFAIVNEWLCKMQEDGVFARFGLSVYNTFAYSGLRAFPYISFEEAVEESVGIVERVCDLTSWYEK